MTVEPMTDVDRIRAQWVDDLRRAVTVSKHDKHMQVSPLQVACLFKALDAERTRADAAEAERDAALARAMPRPMPHGWSKVNHPDPEYVGYRIVGYRMPDVTADGRLGAQMDLVRLCPDLPTPTAAQEG